MKTKKSTMDMVFCVCVSIVFMCVRLFVVQKGRTGMIPEMESHAFRMELN